jgi:uncharacterized protein YjiS (DUF1127 family)
MAITGSISWIIAHIKGRLAHRRTLRLLSGLTDHELDDVGLMRCDIDIQAETQRCCAA